MSDEKDKPILVLIADDEEDIRLNLKDILELEGFDVIEATNGKETLEMLKTNNPDIIISDLMMPEMTGLECLETLERHGNKIPVVIMTAFGTIEYAVKAMKLGAADFVTKPIDYDYMFAVIRRVFRRLELERKVDEQRQQMEEDLRLAGAIQKAVLPKSIDNEHIQFAYRFEPMIEIGGDHICMHEHDDNHISVAVFDVSGHGVAASLVANMVQNELMNRLKQDRPPSNIIDLLNRFVIQSVGKTQMFLTLALIEVDVAANTLIVCNAGHPDVLLWKSKESAIQRIASHAPPIGMSKKLTAIDQESIDIQSGDRIVLYTDGFPETSKAENQFVGVDGLIELVEEKVRFRAQDFLDDIFKTFNSIQIGEVEDDRTLAIVEVK